MYYIYDPSLPLKESPLSSLLIPSYLSQSITYHHMESNRKRRGFMKGKLMPFYRSTKSSSSNLQYTSKVIKPSQSSPSAPSVGFFVHQDYIIAPPKQNNKVSFIISPPPDYSNRDKLSQFEKVYGVPGDESVDIKAASYISSVQERFKLERSHSERIKHEDFQ